MPLSRSFTLQVAIISFDFQSTKKIITGTQIKMTSNLKDRNFKTQKTKICDTASHDRST